MSTHWTCGPPAEKPAPLANAAPPAAPPRDWLLAAARAGDWRVDDVSDEALLERVRRESRERKTASRTMNAARKPAKKGRVKNVVPHVAGRNRAAQKPAPPCVVADDLDAKYGSALTSFELWGLVREELAQGHEASADCRRALEVLMELLESEASCNSGECVAALQRALEAVPEDDEAKAAEQLSALSARVTRLFDDERVGRWMREPKPAIAVADCCAHAHAPKPACAPAPCAAPDPTGSSGEATASVEWRRVLYKIPEEEEGGGALWVTGSLRAPARRCMGEELADVYPTWQTTEWDSEDLQEARKLGDAAAAAAASNRRSAKLAKRPPRLCEEYDPHEQPAPSPSLKRATRAVSAKHDDDDHHAPPQPKKPRAEPRQRGQAQKGP